MYSSGRRGFLSAVSGLVMMLHVCVYLRLYGSYLRITLSTSCNRQKQNGECEQRRSNIDIYIYRHFYYIFLHAWCYIHTTRPTIELQLSLLLFYLTLLPHHLSWSITNVCSPSKHSYTPRCFLLKLVKL